MKRTSIPTILLLGLAFFGVGLVSAQGPDNQTNAASAGVIESMREDVTSTLQEATAAKEAAQAAKNAATKALTEAENAAKHAEEAREAADGAALTAKKAEEAASDAKKAADEAASTAKKAEEAASGAKTEVVATNESIREMSNKVENLDNQVSDILTTPIGTSPATPLPSWIAAGAGFLAVLAAALTMVLIKNRIACLDNSIHEDRRKGADTANAIAVDVKAIRTAVGDTDLKATIQAQFRPLSEAIRSLDNKIGGFDRTIRDIPGQFDAVAKTIKGDSESHRSSILSWLFGRGKTQAPESGFAQQIEERIGQFQTAVLAAVETDRKLQSRKLELDERERKLDERTRNLDAELARARADGAATAERKAAALEAANKAMTESLTAKGTEFGKKVALLESERNAAKTAALQAEAASAAAKRQAEEAVKLREKLAADIARLTGEITAHAKSREADLAKAREEIRATLERANADEIAGLRAEAKAAREERVRADETAKSLRDAKTAAETALASAKAAFEAEKSAHEGDRAAAAQELSAEKAARAAEREAAGKELAAATAERDAAKSRVFPAEFRDDAAFEPLLAQLDVWDAEGVGGATLARASLAIFADRKNLPAKIWLRALGDFSLGLASAMEAEKIPPPDVVATLGKWKAAIEKHAAGGPSFSLNLPSIGTKVDTSWMHAKAGSASVRRVHSWAVYGPSGNAYMAEVE